MALHEPPDRFQIVKAMWPLARPDGTPSGNLAFCRLVAETLRTQDRRWGLNWKRGQMGEPSEDIVAFRWGPTDAECRIVDIIGKASGPWEGDDGRTYDTPNWDVDGAHPEPSWNVHSEADAGPVRWYWTEIEDVPDPENESDDDLIVTDGENAILAVLDQIIDSLETIKDRQDRPWTFRLFGYRVRVEVEDE